MVFTPSGLARRLCEGLPRSLPTGADRGPDSTPRAVLDPACGDGALLLAVLEARAGDPQFARTGLFGIEIDPELARTTRERLRRAAGLPPGTELEQNIRCADALDAASWPARTHVVANPPWLSYAGRHAVRAPRPTTPAGWPSLHGAFLERIARHVAEQRTTARLILPAQVTELERYGPTREAATRFAQLAEPIEELGESAFDDVVGPAVIVTLCARDVPGTGSRAAWSLPSSTDPWSDFERFPRLPKKSFADPGVHTGNSSRELVFDELAPNRAPLRVGRNLAPFALGRASRYLRTDLAPGPARRFRIAPLERYQGFPVLIRQTADRPLAALHSEPGYFRNSLLACRAVEELDPAFVVAVLNGPVACGWHRARFRDARQHTFPQVKVAHLASQPFPFVRRDDDARLHDDVARRVRALAGFAGAHLERERRAIEAAVRDAFGLDERALEQLLEGSLPAR